MKKSEFAVISEDIRKITLNLNKTKLFNREPPTLENVLKILSYADNFDSNYGQLLRNYWNDYKDKGLEREDMFNDFKEKILQLAVDIETYFSSDVLSQTDVETQDSYISQKVLDTYSTRNNSFNYKKLISLISELNDNFNKGNTYSCFMLIRAILDHIPPLVGYETFQQLTNNYPLSQTDKAYANTLIRTKDMLHDALHRPISKSEDLLELSYLPERYYLNRILQICAESEVNANQLSKAIAESSDNKNVKTKISTPPPIVEVTLQSSGGNGDTYTTELGLTNKGQVPAILQYIDITGVPKQELGTFKILGISETLKVSVQLAHTGFRTSTEEVKLYLFYKDVYENAYKSVYIVNRVQRADGLYNIDSLSNFTFFQI